MKIRHVIVSASQFDESVVLQNMVDEKLMAYAEDIATCRCIFGRYGTNKGELRRILSGGKKNIQVKKRR